MLRLALLVTMLSAASVAFSVAKKNRDTHISSDILQDPAQFCPTDRQIDEHP
jgi:hypothetical protein